MTKPVFIPFEFLTADDLNAAFADSVSLSVTGTQTLASTLNLPSLLAGISMQTEQLICTGDLVCTSNSAISMPVGSTLERPNVPVFGMIRGNSDSGLVEVLLQSGNWGNLVTTTAVSTPSTPPVSMAGPSFGQPTSTAIPLGWSNPSGGTAPFTFSVQYRLAGTSNWITWVQETEAFSTTVGNLLPAARYEFQVTAFNASGTATSPVVATNTIGFLAGGPANLTASQPTSTTIALTWLPVTGAAYQVQYAIQGTSAWINFGNAITATSTTVTGLPANTTVYFQVIAKTLGASLESLVAQGATTPAASVSPNLATGLVSSGENTGGFTLSWQAPSAGTQPMSYQVQLELVGTSAYSNYGPATGQLSATLSNLNSASGYNVQVVSTNSAGSSTSMPLSVTTSVATATTGSVAGSENSGPNPPQIVAPSTGAVLQGSALAITGISLYDPQAIYSAGTLALVVSCSTGTVTMTDANGNQISGSGTNTIGYASTYSGISAALASLVYTAKTAGSDNVSIKITDQLIQAASLSIPVSIVATMGSPSPSPPPGGGIPPSTTATGQATDINGTQATHAQSFINGIGVNVRFEDVGYNLNYTQSQAAVLENMINYLGGGWITILREQSTLNANPSWMAQIAQNCGAEYVLAVGQTTSTSSYQTVMGLMEQFAEFFPFSVAAFEGVSGADEFSTLLGTLNNLNAAAQFQSTLYGNAHALGLPCWQLAPANPTNNTTFGSPPADVANTSIYPPFSPNGSGSPFYTTDTNGYLHDAITAAKTAAPGLPVVISNFGWRSFPDGTTNTSLAYVPETVQASYILETMFSAYKQGVSFYIVQELLDVNTVSQQDIGQTFGLFNIQGTQKKIAVAMRNVFGELVDPTATALSFSTGKLNYTVTNKPGAYGGFINTGYQDIVLQNSTTSGVYYIVMWNEQVLNTLGGNNAPINVAPVNVTLTFNETAKSNVQVLDPIVNAFIANQNNVSSMTIALPAHPIIVKVTF